MVSDWEGNKGSMSRLKLLYVIFIDVTLTFILPFRFPPPIPIALNKVTSQVNNLVRVCPDPSLTEGKQ